MIGATAKSAKFGSDVANLRDVLHPATLKVRYCSVPELVQIRQAVHDHVWATCLQGQARVTVSISDLRLAA